MNSTKINPKYKQVIKDKISKELWASIINTETSILQNRDQYLSNGVLLMDVDEVHLFCTQNRDNLSMRYKELCDTLNDESSVLNYPIELGVSYAPTLNSAHPVIAFLSEGHHRLLWFRSNGIPYIPVKVSRYGNNSLPDVEKRSGFRCVKTPLPCMLPDVHHYWNIQHVGQLGIPYVSVL
jgi:hypothetical protein